MWQQVERALFVLVFVDARAHKVYAKTERAHNMHKWEGDQ